MTGRCYVLDDRELAAVLAGLRMYQGLNTGGVLDVEEIATNCGTLDSLSVDEVDDLCERINCGLPEPVPPGRPRKSMTGRQFKEWRKHMGYNRTAAARALVVGRNTPKRWEDGEVPIPAMVDLLCAAMSAGIEPWSVRYEREMTT